MVGAMMEGRMSMRLTLAAIGSLLAANGAEAADLANRVLIRQPIQAANPCGDQNVLGGIVGRFAWADSRTWHSGVVIDRISNARPSGHAYPEPGIIRRAYCTADAAMTDGSGRAVFYAIEYGQGFASIGNYVDFCVVGSDPWHVHDEACRTVR
jgi:hypothetical protein